MEVKEYVLTVHSSKYTGMRICVQQQYRGQRLVITCNVTYKNVSVGKRASCVTVSCTSEGLIGPWYKKEVKYVRRSAVSERIQMGTCNIKYTNVNVGKCATWGTGKGITGPRYKKKVKHMRKSAKSVRIQMVTEYCIMSDTVPMEIETSGGEGGSTNSGGTRENEKGKNLCSESMRARSLDVRCPVVTIYMYVGSTNVDTQCTCTYILCSKSIRAFNIDVCGPVLIIQMCKVDQRVQWHDIHRE